MSNEPLLFYSGLGEPLFSNFAPAKVVYNGQTYQTSEHAYQAAKFITDNPSPAHIEYANQITRASTPNKARILAQQKIRTGYKWYVPLNEQIKASLNSGVRIRSDWNDVRVDIMREIVRAKFTQNKNCRDALLKTGMRPLIEHTPRDSFWADGGNGSGKNMLGHILEEIRAELRLEK